MNIYIYVYIYIAIYNTERHGKSSPGVSSASWSAPWLQRWPSECLRSQKAAEPNGLTVWDETIRLCVYTYCIHIVYIHYWCMYIYVRIYIYIHHVVSKIGVWWFYISYCCNIFKAALWVSAHSPGWDVHLRWDLHACAPGAPGGQGRWPHRLKPKKPNLRVDDVQWNGQVHWVQKKDLESWKISKVHSLTNKSNKSNNASGLRD